jgi:ABC-2 type transport system permease protein
VTHAAPAVPPAGSADVPSSWTTWRVLPSRVVAMCIVELQKIRHDRTELYTRAIQPALWLLIFGETFSRLRAIPTGKVPCLDYLAPGILAQSTLFIAIFYGIQIIWDRDAGVLAKLLVTPTPRAALITGKAFAAGMRALTQAVAILVLSAILGSNALYPVGLMPGRLRAISHVNPLSYEVDALRHLLIGTPGNLLLDIGVLIVAAAAGITAASALLGRLVR